MTMKLSPSAEVTASELANKFPVKVKQSRYRPEQTYRVPGG
jgi:hypothetical protein